MRDGTGPLIGLAGRDGADQELQVVLVRHELPGQFVKQFLVTGGNVFARPVVPVGESDCRRSRSTAD